MSTSMSRRSFVATAAASGACLAASSAFAAEAAPEVAQDYASQVTESIDADVCVVGAGISGIAAGVQAAQEGLKVVMLEAASIRGAVRFSTEGLCAVDSPLQKEQGIEISIADVLKAEAGAVDDRINTLYWKEMLERSGDNIQWLIDCGVEFTGQVDDYHAAGMFPTFHWFPGFHEAPQYYGDHMEEEFNKYEGCEIRLETRGRALKMDGDKVAGVYATCADGVLEVNAPAVILATGGFAGSPEEVAKRYPCMHVGKYTITEGVLTNVGDGLNMVIAAGGVDDSAHGCFLGGPRGDAVNAELMGFATDGNAMWVNQDGVRICDELSVNTSNLVFHHRDIYAIYDAAALGESVDAVEQEAEENPGGVFVADTVAELAEKLGMDPAVLEATVGNFNAMIEAGADTEFGRDLSGAAPIAEAPFAAFHQVYWSLCSFGGTVVNLKYEVVHADGTPIPGLYAAGTECNMNYREYAYSFVVPGGAMGQGVDSGRVAAKNAAQYIRA